MGRYSPKEGKKRRKVTKKILYILKLLVVVSKLDDFLCEILFPPKVGGGMKARKVRKVRGR